jgi:hypothetical protein
VHPLLLAVAPVVEATGGSLVGPDELSEGDIALCWEGEVVGGYRPGGLQGALDRLMAQIEQELGEPLTELDREGKQEVVRRLDERGAFTLRKAVEDIAQRLEVSRFTIYNYLNSTT